MRDPGWGRRDWVVKSALSQSLSLLTCEVDAVTVSTSQGGSGVCGPGGRWERGTESQPRGPEGPCCCRVPGRTRRAPWSLSWSG